MSDKTQTMFLSKEALKKSLVLVDHILIYWPSNNFYLLTMYAMSYNQSPFNLVLCWTLIRHNLSLSQLGLAE